MNRISKVIVIIVVFVTSGKIFAQQDLFGQQALNVVEVIEFQWHKGAERWKENSRRRLHNSRFTFGDGKFSFDLPDMARPLFPIHGTYSGDGDTLYFEGTSQWHPGAGPAPGQTTHIIGTLTVEGNTLLANFTHTIGGYSTTGYSAIVKLH